MSKCLEYNRLGEHISRLMVLHFECLVSGFKDEAKKIENILKQASGESEVKK